MGAGLLVGALVALLAVSAVLLALRRGADREGATREIGREGLAEELDRMENVLRQDPHREDARALYRDLLRRAGAGERRRRREFLDSIR